MEANIASPVWIIFYSFKGCSPHSMLFLRIGKDLVDRFLSPSVEDFVLFHMVEMVGLVRLNRLLVLVKG